MTVDVGGTDTSAMKTDLVKISKKMSYALRHRPDACYTPGVMAELDLWSMLFVFMLATFVGFQVIQNVSRLLHTPLMSLTNALDAIVVVAAIIIAGRHETPLTTALGAVAVAASFSNMVGGFLITDRMLRMFKTGRAKK